MRLGGASEGRLLHPQPVLQAWRRGGWEREAENGELAEWWEAPPLLDGSRGSQSPGPPRDPQEGLLQCPVRGAKVKEGAKKGEGVGNTKT